MSNKGRQLKLKRFERTRLLNDLGQKRRDAQMVIHAKVKTLGGQISEQGVQTERDVVLICHCVRENIVR